MHKLLLQLSAVACGILIISSCSTGNSVSDAPPIILGDSSTIVIETEEEYLQDVVVDMTPAPKPATTDTTIAARPETARSTDNIPAGEGLRIDFKDVNIFIPGIKTYTFKEQNTRESGNAAHQLAEGKLEGNSIYISGATVERVSQRVYSETIVQNSLGTLRLQGLGANTDWITLEGTGGKYPITGLASSELPAPKVSAAIIRNAVTKTTRSRRMSRSQQQQWLNSIGKASNLRQKPLNLVPTVVIWRIDGKDANGNIFQKRLRMDIPIPQG